MDSSSGLRGDSRGITLEDGMSTAASFYPRKLGAVVFGHGLDPTRLTHITDEYGRMLNEACSNAAVSFLAYTARGHAKTSGWQEKDLNQFLWSSLSRDMNEVAAKIFDNSKYIVSGHSMGSASALFAAMQQPQSVSGVILVRPPTAWATRKDRKQHLLDAAARNKDKYAGTEDALMYRVLEGAASANLPPVEAPNCDEAYSKIQCPVLILSYRDDPAHPVATAQLLLTAIPHAEVHVMADEAEAKEKWGAIMTDFLSRVYHLY
jgi:3-oxoadipate enol-lactonase